MNQNLKQIISSSAAKSIQRIYLIQNQLKQQFSDKSKKEKIIYENPTNFFAKVTLNRPKQLNSLDFDMIESLKQAVKQWNNSQAKTVFFTGNGKAFCAGGDIKSLYMAKQTNDQKQMEILDQFFRQEFICDYQLSQMNPVQVCIFNGIVMGGGVGISIHSKIKIATENAVFAMPEAKIGFFTDIGASFFLSRMRNNLGLYLGMTGTRLKGKELVETGLANYFVKSENLDKLENDLKSSLNNTSDYKAISQIISSHSEKVALKYKNEDLIKEKFDVQGGNLSFQDFFSRLQKDYDKNKWCKDTLDNLNGQCPMSLRVIYEQQKLGKKQTLKECFQMDFRLTQKFMADTDFFEGVRCTLIDKNAQPKWKHKSPLDVTEEEIKYYFQNLAKDKELIL